MPKVTLTEKELLLDGVSMPFICGDIHYFRHYPGGLRRRLEWMKAFGLTAVQTYIPWNLHEPEKGTFVFDGLCDLEGFLSLCQELGLKVMLRPSPYICSEWDFGGLPHWLQQEDMVLRSSDPRYLSHVKDYYDVLIPKCIPYLATNGGPIIAVAVENEYGSYGDDKAYLETLRDMLLSFGIDVPLYTTDGYRRFYYVNGAVDGLWAGANYRIESEEAISSLRSWQPDKPTLIGEYWSGRAIHKGETFFRRNADEVAEGFRIALEKGGFVTFYMFAGGSNFGFMNGANYGKTFGSAKEIPNRYIPHATTYDEDSLLNEQGLPTPKYYACRKVLWEFLGKEEPPLPEIPYETQVIAPILLDRSISLWDAVDYRNAAESLLPMTFDQLKQDYGYVLYRTQIVGTGHPFSLRIPQLRDRADVYLNRKRIDTLMRDRKEASDPILIPEGENATLEVLCENCGRINFGNKLGEKVGIVGPVSLHVILYHWQNLSLPFKDLDYNVHPFAPTEDPVILEGRFKAVPGKDTFLDMRTLKKGFVFLNGFNLGRYWNVGPQYTLYVPGELLKEENVIQVFEQYGASELPVIHTCSEQILG